MRSADLRLRACLLAAAMLQLGGCMVMSDLRTAFGPEGAAPPAPPAEVSTATATPLPGEGQSPASVTAKAEAAAPGTSGKIEQTAKSEAPPPAAAAASTGAPAANGANGANGAPAASAAAPAPKPAAPPPPPVDPAVQRAFDDARRALDAGKTAEAERGFLALTRAHPELGGPFANLGLIYRQAGKLNEAVSQLEQAVHANPLQPRYFNELGITYRLRGNFDKAREAYEQALAVDPDYAAAHLNLGILYDIYLWDGARALEHYDRYLALSPGGDDKVKKWVADLKNRGRQQSMLTKQEKP
jgi:tetratricopeptide (TPR) repeat protein